MKVTLLLAAIAGSASAFPIMDDPETSKMARELMEQYQVRAAKRDLSQDPLGISKAQTNCG